MSKKKLQQNRLESLFADLDQETEAPRLPTTEERPPAGWRWECDAEGRYTACGPEVRSILDLEAQAFLGQPLITFGLDPASVATLAAALETDSFPVEVHVHYLSARGERVPISLYIASAPSQEPDADQVWRGFTQVLSADKALDRPEPARPALRRTGPLKPAPEAAAPFPEPAKPALRRTGPLKPATEPGSAAPSSKPAGAAPRRTGPLKPALTPKTRRTGPLQPTSVPLLTTPTLEEAGIDSLESFRPIFRPATPESPASMTMPFQLKEQAVGLLEILDDTPSRAWSEDERRLVEQVADQLSLALENARLFQETQTLYQESQARADELAALNNLGRALGSSLSLDQVLNEIYRGVSRLLDTTNFYIGLYDREKQEIAFPFNVSESVVDREIVRLPANQGITGYIVRTGESVLIKENLTNWLASKGIASVGEPARSWMGVPLLLGDQIVGAMAVQSYTEFSAYDEHDLYIFTAIAAQAAIAIQNARLFQNTQRRAQELTVVNDLSRTISQRLELVAVTEAAYEQIQRIISADAFYVRLYDSATNTMETPLAYDSGKKYSYPPSPLVPGTTVEQVITSGELILINRTPEQVEKMVLSPDQAIGDVSRPSATLLYVPLRLGERVLGILSVQSYSFNAYTPQDVAVVSAIANNVAIAVQNARLFEQAQLRAEELAVLNEMARALTTLLDVDAVAEALFTYTTRLMPADFFLMALYNAETQDVSFPYISYTNQRIQNQTHKLGQGGFTDYVIKTRQPLLLNGDVRSQGTALGIALTPAGEGKPVHSWLGVPVTYGDQVLGVLSLQSLTTPNLYTEAHLNLLSAVASQAASAIQSARLFEQVQQSLAETETLYRASADLNAIRAYENILSILRSSTILGHPHAASVTLNLFDHPWGSDNPPDWMIPLARWSKVKVDEPPMERYPIGPWKSATELVRPDTPTIIENAAQDKRLDETVRSVYIETMHAKSLLLAPLNVGGQWIGHLIGVYGETTAFPDQEIRRLTALASQAATAVQNLYQLELSQARARQERLIREISGQITSSIEIDTILKTTARALSQALGVSHAAIRVGAPPAQKTAPGQ
jgi:GAF domain-containing protein